MGCQSLFSRNASIRQQTLAKTANMRQVLIDKIFHQTIYLTIKTATVLPTPTSTSNHEGESLMRKSLAA
jgi:hypothetical protein